jgi:hypothetical protein
MYKYFKSKTELHISLIVIGYLQNEILYLKYQLLCN